MSMSLADRVALVTGASGGIGAAVARRLAAANVAVAAGYGRTAGAARHLVQEIIAAGGRAQAVGADLAHPKAAADLVDAVERTLGPVDILISNAGVGRPGGIEEVDVAAWDEHMAVNLRAPFLLAQRVLPAMVERRYGRVVFVSSVAAFTGGIVGPHYAASKAGLLGLTHFLASRLAPNGVTVNAVAPALIEDTGMLPGSDEELRARVPVGRLGRPEEVAEVIFTLVSNGYLTNQTVSIDGGMYPR